MERAVVRVVIAMLAGAATVAFVACSSFGETDSNVADTDADTGDGALPMDDASLDAALDQAGDGGIDKVPDGGKLVFLSQTLFTPTVNLTDSQGAVHRTARTGRRTVPASRALPVTSRRTTRGGQTRRQPHRATRRCRSTASRSDGSAPRPRRWRAPRGRPTRRRGPSACW